MKKQYTTPAMFAVDCQSQGLLAVSGGLVGISPDDVTTGNYSQEWYESPFDD